MVVAVAVSCKVDRLLLTIYLIALLGLMMFPIVGPENRILNIGIDKRANAALIGGPAVFFCDGFFWRINTPTYVLQLG